MARAHRASLTSPLETVHAITAPHTSRNVKLSELVGTYLESNQRPNASGGGAFQINLAAHPGVTEKQAENPVWAERFMRRAYESAVKTVGAAAFKANPEQAAERAAYLAERPAKDYYAGQGAKRVHEAYLAATADIHAPVITDLPSGTSGTPGPVVAVGHATAASKAAAQRLWNAGLRGHDLVIALALIGAETKGSFRNSDVTTILNNYKSSHSFKGSKGYDNGAYLKYVGKSLTSLKAIGHKTTFTLKQGDPGATVTEPSLLNTIGSTVAGEAKGAASGITSIGKAIGWLADPDHLIRVGFIMLGFILIIIGLAKLSGATLPVPKVEA